MGSCGWLEHLPQLRMMMTRKSRLESFRGVDSERNMVEMWRPAMTVSIE